MDTGGDTITESNNFSKFIPEDHDVDTLVKGKMLQYELNMDQKMESKIENIVERKLENLKSELAVQFLQAASQDFEEKLS